MGRWWWMLVLLPLLAGCWDRREVDDIAIVKLVAIDKAERGVRLAVRVVIPRRASPAGGGGGGGSGGGGSQTLITELYSADGPTILDALTKLQLKLPRRLFWAHAGPLVIGADYAREGLGPVLDFWSRSAEPRPTMYVAITPGRAIDFQQAEPPLEPVLGESVRKIIKSRAQVAVTIKDFLGALRTPGMHPLATRVELVRSFPGGPQREVRATGTAIFRGDRLVGWLDESETRGLLWLRNEVRTGIITVEPPTGGKVSLQLIRGHTTVRPDFADGRLRLAVHVITEDDILESGAPIDLGRAETVAVIRELLVKSLRDRIEAALRKVQGEYQVDVARLGDAVRRGAPRLWDEELKHRWDEEFPRVPVDLSITAHIRRTGAHGAPLGSEETQVKTKTKELLQGMD